METTERQARARERLRVIAAAKSDETEAILEALDAGLEQKEIAAALECTRERIRLIVRRARPDSGRQTGPG